MVTIARTEPTVVHDETLDADLRRHFGRLHLSGLSDIEFLCFPGVVQHGTRSGVRRLRRQHVRELKAMQWAGRLAQTTLCVAGTGRGSLERFR